MDFTHFYLHCLGQVSLAIIAGRVDLLGKLSPMKDVSYRPRFCKSWRHRPVVARRAVCMHHDCIGDWAISVYQRADKAKWVQIHKSVNRALYLVTIQNATNVVKDTIFLNADWLIILVAIEPLNFLSCLVEEVLLAKFDIKL